MSRRACRSQRGAAARTPPAARNPAAAGTGPASRPVSRPPHATLPRTPDPAPARPATAGTTPGPDPARQGANSARRRPARAPATPRSPWRRVPPRPATATRSQPLAGVAAPAGWPSRSVDVQRAAYPVEHVVQHVVVGVAHPDVGVGHVPGLDALRRRSRGWQVRIDDPLAELP